jgi:hypothetical protein
VHRQRDRIGPDTNSAMLMSLNETMKAKIAPDRRLDRSSAP